MNQIEKLEEATIKALQGKLNEDNHYGEEVTLKECDNFKLVGSKDEEDGHVSYYLRITPKSHLKFSTDMYVQSRRGIINDITIGTSSYGSISVDEMQEMIATLKEEVDFVNEILNSDRDYKDQLDKLSK